MLTPVVPLLAYMVISLSLSCAAFSPVHRPARLPAQRSFARLPAESLSGRALHPARPRAHSAALRMVSEFDMLTLAQVVGTIVEAPQLAYSSYMGALDTNALAVDSVTASLLYACGKATSSAISKKSEDDMLRFLVNWAMLGVIDGVCTHEWYGFIQGVADDAQVGKLAEAFAMTLTSSLLYTPLYCAGFLALLSLLEGRGWQAATERVRLDLRELFAKTTQVWGPTNLLLFGLVPLHLRTVVSMAIHYVFLVGLALWDAAARDSREARSRTPAAGPEGVNAGSMSDMLNLRVATAFKPDLKVESPDLLLPEA